MVHSVIRLWGTVQTCGTLSDQVMGNSTDLWYTQQVMGNSTDLWYTQSADYGEQYRPVVHSVSRIWGAVQTCGTLSDQVMGSSTDLWYTQSAGYG